jgi:DNA primase
MPITWDELEHIQPPDFRIDTAVAHVKEAGDKWRDIVELKQARRPEAARKRLALR